MKAMKRKRLWLVIGITLAIGIGGGWWLNRFFDNKTEKVAAPSQKQPELSESSGSEDVEEASGFNSVISPALEESDYSVTRVIDGDTIDVEIGGVTQRVRLIGIDTPESVDPRQGVECFGKEASVKLKDLIEGEVVGLEADASQSNKDKYGRLLRYVFDNEININSNLRKRRELLRRIKRVYGPLPSVMVREKLKTLRCWDRVIQAK